MDIKSVFAVGLKVYLYNLIQLIVKDLSKLALTDPIPTKNKFSNIFKQRISQVHNLEENKLTK